MEYIFFEYCRNEIVVITVFDNPKLGEYSDSTCGYTGGENHYICLGELGKDKP